MPHNLYRGFDPIWSGHKKDLPTLMKYLNISSRVYYLSIFIASLLIAHINFSLFGNSVIETSVGFLVFFVPPLLLFYFLQVYRQFWYICPVFNVKDKIVKIVFGFWIMIFLLVDIFQLIVGIPIGQEEINLFGWLVTFSNLFVIANMVLALIGEFLLGIIKNKIEIIDSKV
ncbi:MAG: hypothetical protein A2538_03660 [Candidatus Magasanikbacteria bacterium RIFOXYD2_FULL_41_14]|uniref:Uncharacterized protein n=1 Tax=Candidatus Magasanikbacteria bacterium RIFOXYD2_FULL_41_14 TaxID=1798709 RepID=A0A1F6PCP1_9BACT|nr:MAG: hypothetical protein A2538_03660 [Candidatus Magasanikbacteria bacterium RIFOXYD2_FULL_41_14]